MPDCKLPIVLASASPRRSELLERCAIEFTVLKTQADERCGLQDPEALVLELCGRKARAADALVSSPCAIIAADTVVFSGGKILGKPRDKADAFVMLKALANSTHTVYTGVCVLVHGGAWLSRCCQTDVTIGELDDAQIRAYIDTGEPMDKAGAYAVQGRFARHVSSIHGCFYNVMGLPLHMLCQMLGQLGIAI